MKLLKGFAIFVVAVLAIHGIVTLIQGSRVRAQLNAISARGEPVSMAELGEPKVPDAENAAVVYAKAFEAAGDIVDSQNSHLRNVLDRFLSSDESDKDPELELQTRQIVTRCEEALPLLEEAASRPKCQFPVDWEKGYFALLPHCAKLRTLRRVVSASAILEAKDGRMDEAIRRIELNFKIGESLRDDPSLIGQLSRARMLEANCAALRDALEYGDISESQAERLAGTLAEIDLQPGFVRAVQAERALGLWAFDHLRTASTAEMKSSAEIASQPCPLIWLAGTYAYRPVIYADELCFLRLMEEQIERARVPARELQDIELDFPFYAFISKLVCPDISRATMVRAMVRDGTYAELAGTQTFLALRVYRDRFGSYPATLDELKAKLAWDLPQDPFSGEDLVYKREGEGFLLYSVGKNLKDDGGRPKPESTPGAPTDEAYDIVWQRAR